MIVPDVGFDFFGGKAYMDQFFALFIDSGEAEQLMNLYTQYEPTQARMESCHFAIKNCATSCKAWDAIDRISKAMEYATFLRPQAGLVVDTGATESQEALSKANSSLTDSPTNIARPDAPLASLLSVAHPNRSSQNSNVSNLGVNNTNGNDTSSVHTSQEGQNLEQPHIALLADTPSTSAMSYVASHNLFPAPTDVDNPTPPTASMDCE